MKSPVLKAIELEGGYGPRTVLHGVCLEVKPGEIVAVVGSNGSGKSTLLKAVMGLLRPSKGQVFFEGRNVTQESPARHVHAGIAYLGQGNRVFDTLSVEENLEMGGYLLSSRSSVQSRKSEVYDLLPVLAERKRQVAASLSGGERQALAFGMGLMLDPRIFLLDEPSVGLSSELTRVALSTIKQISVIRGTAILIVEQKVREVLRIADRGYILALGRVAFQGARDEVEGRLQEYFRGAPATHGSIPGGLLWK